MRVQPGRDDTEVAQAEHRQHSAFRPTASGEPWQRVSGAFRTHSHKRSEKTKCYVNSGQCFQGYGRIIRKWQLIISELAVLS